MSSSEGPEPRPVIPARQARQGVTGHNVRFVLGFSIAAVVIVFPIIWFVYFAYVIADQALRCHVDAATLLNQTLNEEKATDKKLTEMAESQINRKVA